MRIRTQLVLAWLILSVLPLTVIVLYSHHTSREALETAEQREAATLAKQMDRRLGTIRNEISQRLADVSALPIGNIPADADGNANPVVGNILAAMGETASLVDALEFRPARRLPPAQPREAARPAPVAPVAPVLPAPAAAEVPAAPAAPAPLRPQRVVIRTQTHPDPNPNPDINVQLEPGREAIIIDIPPAPRMPRFHMTQEQRALITEIGRLGVELGTQPLTPEEKQAKQKAIDAKQKELHKSLETTRKSYDAQIAEAHRKLEERQKAIEARNLQRDLARAERDRQRELERREKEIAKQQAVTATDVASAPPPEPPVPPVTETIKPAAAQARVRTTRELTPKEKEELKEAAKKSTLLLGRGYNIPVRKEGEVVGQITAQLRTEEVVKRVLGGAAEDGSEIPFAIDRERNIYTRNERDRRMLERIGVIDQLRTGKTMSVENWIVAFTRDEESGLRVGVARPVGENLRELRATAATNFGYGLALIAVALIGIVPLANHISRDVETVTKGAQRIAHGDLMTRLPVRSDNEIGQLSKAFNRMAEDLSHQQQQLVEQQRMAIEYERKSVELEEARRFQLSMLPKEVPRHERYSVAVATQTAAEVGGDYYDFHVAADGTMSVTIGDATGHGAKAGTMVTVIKTLFAGYSSGIEPGAFLADAAEKIRRMDLGRMAMALSLARFDGHKLTVASAGMPPVLVHRASGEVEELALEATPLGTLLGREYAQRTIDVHSGDTVLFLSDGFPELQNAEGHQLGYGAALSEFAMAAKAADAAGVIDGLTAAARRWHGDAPPNDDITFVAVRVT